MAQLGHGKVILLGEHAVVFGRPALAAGLSRGVVAVGRPAEAPRLVVSPWGIDIGWGPSGVDDVSDLGRAFAALLEAYPSPPKVRIDAEVAIPAGAGLGCSAALGVAVQRALDEAVLGRPRSDEAVAEASMPWERVFHGTPSGVDSAVASAGGVRWFVRGEPLREVPVGQALHLVVADSGEPGSTKEMVASVRRQHSSHPARMNDTFDAVESLVRNGRLAIEGGDLRALGQLMDLNQSLLASMLVSTQRLEEMCATARERGALGAKLTGGGGGGCMIALVPDAEVGAEVEAALASYGRVAFSTRIEASGRAA
jgi:mevalonate kinase